MEKAEIDLEAERGAVSALFLLKQISFARSNREWFLFPLVTRI